MSTAFSSTKRYYSPAEYLAQEKQAGERHEYFRGEILLMAGSTPDHDRIAGTIQTIVDSFLLGNVCEVFTSNMRVKVGSNQGYTYPDVTVACHAEFEEIEGVKALTNPSAIFEVVSESTERIDRGRKLGQYVHIPSLREYLIVAQDEMRIDHLVRTPEDNWRLNIQTQPDAVIHLESISLDLKLSDIYRRVQLPSQEPQP